MAKSESIKSLAQMIKQGDKTKKTKGMQHKPPLGASMGEVLSPPPAARIRMESAESGDVILENRHLIWARWLLDGEVTQRKHKLHQAPATGRDSDGDSLSTIEVPEYMHETLETVQSGDRVILLPMSNEQRYFVLDWGVVFE